MPKAKINDIELYYEQHGNPDGDAIVLIHGLNGSHLGWANILSKLGEHYHLTIFDNRGSGQSSVPKGPYSIAQMADDTVALMNYLHIETAHIVGHSMGGAIAQHLAATYPEKLKKLILYATASKFDARCMHALDQIITLTEQGASQTEIARLIGLPWCMSQQFFADPEKVATAYKLTEQNPYPMTLAGSKAQTAACHSHDSRELLNKIQAWTMVISLEQDILTPPNDGQYMAARIPNARFIEIKDYAHCWHLEAPDYFCNQVHLYIGRKKV